MVGDIILAGMGAAVSDYIFVREASKAGAFGILSGTALNEVMVRRLGNGDPTGEIREALNEFPNQMIAERIIDDFYIRGGKAESDQFKGCPFPRFHIGEGNVLSLKDPRLEELIVAANFVEVKLAKKGHKREVGINYLHKIQWPLMPSIYGAMLAGVDAVFIGAGLPREVGGVMDAFSVGNGTKMKIPVINKEGKASGKNYQIEFDPYRTLGNVGELNRPYLVGIISNQMGLKGLPNVDGYVAEKCDDVTFNMVAGGHVPGARSKKLREDGQPDYGEKDSLRYHMFRSILQKRAVEKARGLKLNSKDSKVLDNLRQPFWLAGNYANNLNGALSEGAEGIQVGTLFAYCCKDSGIETNLRHRSLTDIMNGVKVVTNPYASPSGFPFNVLQSDGTIASKEVYDARRKVCTLGYLGELVEDNDQIIMRCPAEPTNNYLRKGGLIEDTYGRTCLCNGLVATVGLGSPGEPPIATAGLELGPIKEFVNRYGMDGTAEQIIDYIRENA